MRVAICLFSRMQYRRICFEDEINEESCQSTLGSSSVALFVVCVGHHLTFRNECGGMFDQVLLGSQLLKCKLC